MNLNAGKKNIPSTKFIQLFYTLFYILRSALRIFTQCKYTYLSSHLCSSVDFSLLSVNGWSHPLRRIWRRELKNMLILAIEQMFAMYCLLSRKNIFGSSSLSNSCIVNWTEWMSPSGSLTL